MTHQFAFDLITTRKPHRCWGCVETFPKGTRMWRWSGKSDGALLTTHTCEPCQVVIDRACKLDRHLAEEGLDEGCVREWRHQEKMAEARLETARALRAAEEAIARSEKAGPA